VANGVLHVLENRAHEAPPVSALYNST
jgi:hypothetical protein